MMNAVEFKSGDVLGRYELLFPAGKGGMGQVWAAKLRGSQGFRKLVALKTLLGREAHAEQAQRMLREEAMLVAHIKSPHVAETLDFGLHHGVPYLVMEWVEGESLAELLEESETALSLRHAVAIVTQALKGLGAAHDARDAGGNLLGLVHRDISPPNILVSYTGLVKLADFGIAKVTHGENVKVESGLKGKFDYMAPEQVRGERVDARTDLFAMSALLYRLLTTRCPFSGKEPGETLWQISSSLTPRAPRAYNGNVPARVEEVILRGLEKQPTDRFQSASEMLEALERAVPPPLRGNGESVVAQLMNDTLGERRDQRQRETARALLSAPPNAALPSPQASTSTFKGLTYSAPPSAVETVQLELPAGLPTRRRVRAWSTLGLGAVLLSLALVFGFELGPEAKPAQSVSASATPDASLTDVERSSTPPPRPQRVPGVIEPEASANAETESAPIEPEQAKPPAPEAVKPRARSGAERSEPSQQTRRQPRAPAKRPPSKQTGAQQERLHSADDLKAPY